MSIVRILSVTAALLAAEPALAQSIAPAPQPVQETCGVFVLQSEDQTSYIPLPGYSVTNAALPLRRPEGQAQIDGVICDRLSLAIWPNDYHVLTDLGVPFYVRSGIRLAALELAQGQMQMRFLRGAPTDEERAQIATALDLAQELAAAERAASPSP